MPTLNRNHGVFECLDAHGRVLYDVPASLLEIELADVQALPAGAFLIDMIDGDDVYQVLAVNGATVEVAPLAVAALPADCRPVAMTDATYQVLAGSVLS